MSTTTLSPPLDAKPFIAMPSCDWDSMVGLRRAIFGSRYENMERLRDAGDMCRFDVLGQPMVLVNSPPGVYDVLVNSAEAFAKGPEQTGGRRPLLEDTLFSSDGDVHRQHRRLVAPALNARRVARFAGIMARQAEDAQRDWHTGDVVRLNEAMERLSINIIGESLLSQPRLAEGRYGDAQRLLVRLNSELKRLPTAWPQRWRVPSRRKTMPAIRLLEGLVHDAIRERRGDGPGEDIAALLVDARDEDGGGMSDDELRAEVLLILLAGTVNVSKSVSWAWYLLAERPALYARLQDEVDGALGGRPPTVDDLPRLPFALQVLKEAMRFRTSSDLLRFARQDVLVDGYEVPRGTCVWICPYLLHHRAAAFASPDEFCPERFAPEQEKLLPRYAFLPFGAGPHTCAGNHFALMEGQIMIAALAQRVSFTLLPGQDMRLDRLTGLRRGQGGRVRVTRRS